MQNNMMGYGGRPRGFAALFGALTRLGFPGGAGLGYPMAAIGPTAGMTPGWATMMAAGGAGKQGMMGAGMAGKQGMMGFGGQPGLSVTLDGQPIFMIGPNQQ